MPWPQWPEETVRRVDVHGSVRAGCDQRVEFGEHCGSDGFVLLAVSAADPDRADDLTVVDERKPADEDRELAGSMWLIPNASLPGSAGPPGPR